jgi:hypothetical protein
VALAIRRLADTHYGSPRGRADHDIRSRLGGSEASQNRYQFNLPQILVYVYAHKIDQDPIAAKLLLDTDNAHIGNLGKHRLLSIGFKTPAAHKSRKPDQWQQNLVGSALESVRGHLRQGQLHALLLPIDHSLNIIPHVIEPLDSDGFPRLPKAEASAHAEDIPRE